MLLNKAADGPGEEHHDAYRHDHSNDHNDYFIYNTNRGKDRVEREDDIQQDDLENGALERDAGVLFLIGFLAVFALHFVVDLHGAFCDEEQSAEAQDEVAAAERHCVLHEEILGYCEQGFSKCDDPGDTEEEANTNYHGQCETHITGTCTVFFGELVRYNGDEYDVVDAVNNFEKTK